jgi:prepilin-type N-terminal cleavage/methylation domain-containing protein
MSLQPFVRKPYVYACKGFTLLEVLLAAVILGVGIAAALNSMIFSTRSNAESNRLTEATFLAQEIRTWTESLPFSDQDPSDMLNPPGPDSYDDMGVGYVDDLDDLYYSDFSPPRDSLGNPIDRLSGWVQRVRLSWRSEADPQIEVEPGSSDLIYVEVSIGRYDDYTYRYSHELSTGWLRARESD